jgi:hypothetical protein
MNEEIDPVLVAVLGEPNSPAAEQPVPEWPDAKALCLHYGFVIRNLPGYRQGMASCSIVDLAYEFAVMDHLVRFLHLSDEPVAKLAGPAMAQLRDICLAEGARRGVILSAGDDAAVLSLSLELMDEMVEAFTPTWTAAL